MIKLSASFLDSYIYLIHLNPTAPWYDKTERQFHDRIKGIDTFEETPAMTRGKFFEEDVEAMCKDNYVPRKIKLSQIVDIDKKGIADEEITYDITKYPIVQDFVNICKGGSWQDWINPPYQIKVNDIDFVIFARTDNINICKHENKKCIFDLKRNERNMRNKYAENSQHLIYMLGTGITIFKYIKAYGEGIDIAGKAEEVYFLNEKTEPKLRSIIDSFLNYLKTKGLYDIFLVKHEYKKRVWW